MGKLLTDGRRGDSPHAASYYTFSVLVTTEALITRDPDRWPLPCEPLETSARTIGPLHGPTARRPGLRTSTRPYAHGSSFAGFAFMLIVFPWPTLIVRHPTFVF